MFFPTRHDEVDEVDLELRTPGPTMNLTLLALTTAISVACWWGWLDVRSLAISRDHPRVLQFVSHAFVHAGPGHLFVNGLCLLAFGNLLNRKLGHARYLTLYLTLCVAGGLGWLAVDHGRAAIGASAVATALAGLFLVAYPKLRLLVYVPTMAYVWTATFLLFALLGSLGIGPFGVWLAALIAGITVLVFQARYFMSSHNPPEGMLLAFLGFRAYRIRGLWVVLGLLVSDVLALSIGLKGSVAHATHLFGAATGLLLGLLWLASGHLRGSSTHPSLDAWVPAARPTRPRTRRTARLSFSEWRQQQLCVATSESDRLPRAY